MEKKFNKKPEQAHNKHRINRDINSFEVRLIGDNIDDSGSIYKTFDALKVAKSLDLDLVEISPNAVPPIAKIVDYKKFLYSEEKKKKELEKKQKENNKPLKEVQFTPNIGSIDVAHKTKQIREFLLENHKVKVVMKFRQGRELQNSLDKGELVLYSLLKELEDIAKAESLPKLNGKTMIVLINPKK